MDNKNMSSVQKITDIIPLHKTRKAVKELETLLNCENCKKLPTSAIAICCEHTYCMSCVNNFSENCCPLCKIPTLPCDRKSDSIIRCLAESCKDLITLFDGGTISINSVGLEAPESSSQFLPNVASLPPIKASSSKEPCTKEKNVNNNKNIGKIQRKTLKTNQGQSDLKVLNTQPIKKEISTTPKLKSYTRLPTTPSINNKSRISEVKTPRTPAINKRNPKGETFLHTQCMKGNLEKVKDFLEDGANPNTKDNAGWTPLHEACNSGYIDIVSSLIEHGAIIDVPGPSNETPLAEAVTSGFTDIINLLRKRGANDQIRDLYGRTPRSLASVCKSDEINSALDQQLDESLQSVKPLESLVNRMVLLESSLLAEQRKNFEKVVKLLKVKHVSEFNSEVTHLVVGGEGTENQTCQRTMKYLMGVVSGKWIVSHKWLDACIDLGGPANPEEFEIAGSTQVTCTFAPKNARINSFKMNPGLFRGCHFFLISPFNSDGIPTKKEIEALIRVGEGVLLQREPNPENIPDAEKTVPIHCKSDKDPLWKCSHFCIYHEGVNEPKLKYDMAHIKSLPLSWLLDSANNFSLVQPYK